MTTAAAVVLFLLYIFLDLNPSDAQETFILHIFLCLSLKLFHEISASLSDWFLFLIENITLPVSEKQSLFPWFNYAHLDEL